MREGRGEGERERERERIIYLIHNPTTDYIPKECVVVDTQLPELFAAFVCLHVKSNHALKHLRLQVHVT